MGGQDQRDEHWQGRRRRGASAGEWDSLTELIRYVSFPVSEVEQPPKHLRGYDKVYLQPGEQRRIVFPLVSKSVVCASAESSARRISAYGTSHGRSGPSLGGRSS